MEKDIRWKQRFQNFEKSRNKLHKVFNVYLKETDNEIYQMALIQVFEFTYELGWKTVKDFLAYGGLQNISIPRDVIKQGFHHKIITNGQVWINMLEDRNLMAHTYDQSNAEKAILHITENYIEAIDQVYNFLKIKL